MTLLRKDVREALAQEAEHHVSRITGNEDYWRGRREAAEAIRQFDTKPFEANVPWDAEEIARLFHETYEQLAPHFGYETRQETRKFDPNSPNGQLMIAVCGEVCIAALVNQAEAERESLAAQLAEAQRQIAELEAEKADDTPDAHGYTPKDYRSY